MKNDRLFQLLYLLLERGMMSAPELSRELEVSVRTIYRDVEALSMSGVPIYATAGKRGGISLLPGYTFDKTLLSDEEQNQLLFALQSVQSVDQNLEALLHKLGTAFQKRTQNWIEVDFSRWGMQKTDTARFDQLKAAILGRQVLHLCYCGASGEITKREIYPVKLIYKDKHWYLQAFCQKAGGFRLFKVGRMLEVSPTGEIAPDDGVKEIPPIESESTHVPTVHLKLCFAERLAFRVYDEFDHSSVSPQADGSLFVKVDFPMDSWVVGYLFSFGQEVSILEPVWLREKLSDYAQKISDHHKT